MREELAHHFLCLFYCQILSQLFVDFIGELGAVVNHLLHSHILCELAVLVAVDAPCAREVLIYLHAVEGAEGLFNFFGRADKAPDLQRSILAHHLVPQMDRPIDAIFV